MVIICSKCSQKFGSNRDLQKHLKRKFPCDKIAFNCKKCNRPFHNRDSFYHHQKHCAGKPVTIEDKNREIQSLKNALAATNGLNAEIQDKRQQIINNNVQNNDNSVSIETLNQITQNIVIMPTGSEDIDHLKGMSVEQLKNKIGLTTDPNTHIEAFKLIRLDPEHPENHNILLTDRDSNKVHWYADKQTGWQEGDYLYQVRNAIFDTNKQIEAMIPYKDRQNSDYYWNHLVRGIPQACNERNDAVLKPIFEGIRDPLHQATLRLMNKDVSMPDDFEPSTSSKCQSIDGDTLLTIEKERTKQIELKENARTRQLELQIELAKLQAVQHQ